MNLEVPRPEDLQCPSANQTKSWQYFRHDCKTVHGFVFWACAFGINAFTLKKLEELEQAPHYPQRLICPFRGWTWRRSHHRIAPDRSWLLWSRGEYEITERSLKEVGSQTSDQWKVAACTVCENKWQKDHKCVRLTDSMFFVFKNTTFARSLSVKHAERMYFNSSVLMDRRKGRLRQAVGSEVNCESAGQTLHAAVASTCTFAGHCRTG